jgi:WD40 repeat protein
MCVEGSSIEYALATHVEGFHIVRRIGRGGGGEVYEAERLGPGGFRRRVALKLLTGDDAIRGASIERLLAEARVLAGLDHPNIVRVFDVIASDAGYVVVLELLDGKTFGALVEEHRARGGLPIDRVVAFADQALAGLAYVHRAADETGRPLGLVHRDITPSNLFITNAGTLKLLDFGIAKLREAVDAPITREREIRGTIRLIAPEIARGEPADPRSDLYQLGACLYWAVSGRYPHGDGSDREVLGRAVREVPPPLASLRPDLPARFVAAVDRAMAFVSDERFVDADAMRAGLAAPARSRRKLVGIGVTAAALTGGAALVGLAIFRTDADDQGSSGRLAPEPGDRGSARDGAAQPDPSIVRAASGPTSAFGADRLPDGSTVFATGREIIVASPDGSVRSVATQGLTPYDVERLTGPALLVTGLEEGTSGSWASMVVGDGRPRSLFSYHRRTAVAASPDGASIAYATMSAIVIAPTSGDRTMRREVVNLPGHDDCIALSWSPDGQTLAFVRDAGTGVTDATIEIVPASGGPPRIVARRPIGDANVVAWAGNQRLVYASHGSSGTRLVRLATVGGDETVIAELPGERILGARVHDGVVTMVRGRIHAGLLASWSDGSLLPLAAPVRGIAGMLWSGRVVFETEAGKLAVIGADGALSATQGIGHPSTRADDRPVGDDNLALVARPITDGVELLRVDATGVSRRLAVTSARGVAHGVRCAGDVAAPCVLADGAHWPQIDYWLFDPQTGARVRKIVELGADKDGGVADHAVSLDGKTLAVVEATKRLHVYDLASGASNTVFVRGAKLDRIAWRGEQLIASARDWRGRSWVLLAVGLDGTARMIAEERTRLLAEPRALGQDIAIAVTDVDTAVSTLTLPRD